MYYDLLIIIKDFVAVTMQSISLLPKSWHKK